MSAQRHRSHYLWRRRGRRAWGALLGFALWATTAPAIAADTGDGIIVPDACGHYTYTNRLIHSHDPYLLLHAHNPVDWYPWGPEAIAAAKRENKPIFLSVGYSTCYWCHVALRTLYSKPEIAKLMNDWFINVKVDREERPDVDRVYMLATELLAGHGGWPNNVFLTPELKPFFAGSYFPPDDDPARGPGFPTVLRVVHEAWAQHAEDKVKPAAEEIYQAMLAVQAGMTKTAAAAIRPDAWRKRAGANLLPLIDAEFGGLKDASGGTKFPQAPRLALLLAEAELDHNDRALAAVTAALDAMAYGGVHDQLAGGFHRYATESTWSIPHFEKMLYDNAQLLALYAEAYRASARPLYRQVALDVGHYLGREMMAREGGFYTAQDAEVKGEEGASYLWTRREIDATLGESEARRFLDVYALTPLAGPGAPAPSPEAIAKGEAKGVLRVRLPIADALKRTDAKDVATMLDALTTARAKLLAVRALREQPFRDDKIVVGLNGLAIAALARGGAILGEPEFGAWARRAAERLWAQAYEARTGTLSHDIFAGHVETEGFLQDYALLEQGMMALDETTKMPVWRERAKALADAMLARFARPDGTLSVTSADANLLIPVEDAVDEDVPSGTSAALGLLLHLAAATGDARYGDAAMGLAHHLSGRIEAHPELWASAVTALAEQPPASAATAGAAARAAVPSAIQPYHMPDTADHVHASMALTTRADHDEVAVTLKIDAGYHINANPASLDYLIPTRLALDNLTPTGVVYPEPTLFKPAFAPDPLKVYEGAVIIVAELPKGVLAKAGTVRGAVEAQACDAEICLPPATLPVTAEGAAH